MNTDLPPPPPTAPSRRFGIGWLLLICVVVIACFLWLRKGAGKTVETADKIPTVGVAVAGYEDLYNEVRIPAEFRPYVEADLNAKVAGYLQSITVDFGDKVKAGQLLATLEVPELKDELDSAVAAEQRSEADFTNAQLMYNRLTSVVKEHPTMNLVAEQDIDNAQAKFYVTRAAVAAAKADVEKYRTLFDYTRITAPFDGVITRRFADPGALIQAGTASDSQARPLVRVSDNYHLRLDFPVSVDYVKDVHVGNPVSLRVDSFGGKTYTGNVTRFTDRVTEDTRTMITEIEVANPDLELIPGMYATVLLRVQHHPRALAIPTQAVSPGSKDTVYIVNQDNVVEQRTVTLGLETPFRFEVTSGLKEGDKVVIGSRGRMPIGQKVETKVLASDQEEKNP